MSKSSVFKKIVPTALIVAAIVGLAVLSFLPVFRSSPAASVSPRSLDDEALSALSVCRAYLDGHAFSTKLDGSIRAKVFGIPYTQKLCGGREVSGSNVCERGESASALVKAAVMTELRDGAYYVSRGAYRGKSFVYDDMREISRSEYYAAFGKPVSGLVKYELDGSVIGAKTTGENTYTYYLDPSRATVYSRCSVKTALDSKSFPEYDAVEFTLYTDGSRPVRVSVRESFNVDKYGGAHCVCTYSESFVYPE